MRLSLLQRDIKWADPAANITAAESALLACKGSDVCVLPEMWPTGFLPQPSMDDARNQQQQTLDWLQRMADWMDCALVGSMATLTSEGEWRNRLHFIRPHRQPLFYDKHHLFTYAGEHLHYIPGTDRLVVEWRGTRFLPLVCYDLRFPMWSRNRTDGKPGFPTRLVTEEAAQVQEEAGRAEYDVLLYVASWPASRAAAWKSLLVARAIENQCYACGVNRIGDDPNCHYSGGTLCVDPYGNIADQVPDDQEGNLTVEIDMDRLKRFRRKFPVLEDVD